MADCLVQCPRCMGEAWITYDNLISAVNRTLKCELCNDDGMAHVQDIIDYYAFLSDKAPEEDKIVRWESYMKMNEKECKIPKKDSAETEG